MCELFLDMQKRTCYYPIFNGSILMQNARQLYFLLYHTAIRVGIYYSENSTRTTYNYSHKYLITDLDKFIDLNFK